MSIVSSMGARFRLRTGRPKIDALKSLNYRSLVCLPIILGLVTEASAGSWTCQKAAFSRQVVVFYPEAPAQLPCKVFYAKPQENVLPRVLWEAKNTHNYCKRKAAEFIEKLSAAGWRCYSDELEQ